MTLIITAFVAIIATILRFALSSETANRLHLGFMALMFWGASIMWTVDGIACLLEGEPFVELSDAAAMTDDALLGVCVVVLGLVVWGIVNLIDRAKGNRAASAA